MNSTQRKKDLGHPAQILTLPIYHIRGCNSMQSFGPSFSPKKLGVEQVEQLEQCFSNKYKIRL